MTFAALAAYGWNDRWAALLAEVDAPGAVPGRVVRHDGVALGLALPDGVRQVHFTRTLDRHRRWATGWWCPRVPLLRSSLGRRC